jgi:hypothetical protein
MTPKRHTLVAAVTLAMLLLTSGIGLASPAATSQSAAIKLKAATFTPGRGEKPALRAGLAAAAAVEGKNAYYLVQFSGPVEQAWKDQVAATGAELLDYVPDFTFKVRATPAIARQIEQLSNVAYVGQFHPAYKLSPELKRDGVNIFKVRIERGADAAAAAAAIKQSGVQVLGRDKDIVLIAADGAKLDAIAQVLDVAWVQNFVVFEKHNQYGGGAIMGANIANASGYDGSTQIAAVADTGIGGGTATTAHRDIPSSRVQAIQNFPGASGGCFQSIIDDGSVDVDSGHGTHVAGSVLSGGGLSGEGKGVAPAAKLVFQSIENYAVVAGICAALYGYTDGYYLTGIPDDLNTLFQQAYNAGARIHSNSWGSAAAGDYTLDSSNADKFVWNNRDMVITFSAGNEGIDANSDGVVDNDSIGSPATAKNVITIGASENDRQGNYQCDTSLTYTSHDATYQSGQTCGSMSGQNLLGTYGQRWGADYPANPIASDPTAGNQEQMASFSSRGPTDDGRIKPDVVAPGTWILSTYSSQYQEGYGDPVNPRTGAYQSDGWGIAYNEYYKYFGGTSMSNPLAGGAATVVRDYYNKAKSYTTPSAALIKATLINSAVDLLDENNDGVNDNDYPVPNNFEGWGRINLVAATDGSIQYLDQKTGLATNGVSTSQVNVTTSGPLKLTVVWSDYQSTETATANLVNDLDLVVTSPSGTVYRGNVFSGGWSATGGTADRKNNVESVYIQSAATGNWTVEVKGFNVPNGPQPFALVADGGALSTVTPTPPAAPTNLTATPVSRSQINLSWTDASTNETGFKIERCAGSTCTNFTQIATVGANVTTFSNTGLSRSTAYRYRVRATNGGGDSAYSNIATATTPRN